MHIALASHAQQIPQSAMMGQRSSSMHRSQTNFLETKKDHFDYSKNKTARWSHILPGSCEKDTGRACEQNT